MTVGELVAKARVDGKEFDRGLNKQESALRRAAGRMSQTLNVFKRDADRKMGEAGESSGNRFTAGIARAFARMKRESTKTATDTGKESGKALGDGLVRHADGRLRDSRGRFAKAGAEAAGGFVKTAIGVLSGAGGSISKAISNPYVLAIGAPLALAATIGALAVVNAGLLLGIGGGFIAMGAMAALGSERGKRAVGDLGTAIKQTGKAAALSMQDPIIRSLEKLRRTANDVRPDLTRLFAHVAPHIDGLSDGVDKFIRKLVGGGGLDSAVRSSGLVLDAFSVRLPGLADDLDTMFNSIGEGGKGSAAAMTLLMIALGGVATSTGRTVEGGSKLFLMLARLSGIGGDALNKYVNALEEAKPAEDKAKTGAEELEDGLEQLKVTTDSIGAAIRKMNDGLKGSTLSLAAATTDASIARRKLSDSLKENGSSFQVGTKAGDANRQALEGVARSAMTVRDSVIDMNIRAGKDQAEAFKLGDKAMGDYVFAMAKTTLGAKLSEEQIHALLVEFGLLPPGKSMPVKTPGAVPSATNVKDLQRQIALLRAKSVAVTANVQGTGAALALGAAIARLHNRELLVTTTYRKFGIGHEAVTPNGPGYFRGGSVRKRANGGSGGLFSGMVRGAGTPTSDDNMVAVGDGEFVVRGSSAGQVGANALNYINRYGRLPIPKMPTPRPGTSAGTGGGGMDMAGLLAELRALRGDVRAMQMTVQIGDETVAKATRRGERQLGFRG